MKKKKVKHSVAHLTLEIYKRNSIKHDEKSFLINTYPPATLLFNSSSYSEYEKDGYLLIAVDPRAPVEEVMRYLKPLLAHRKKFTKTASKRKIDEREKWLKLVDEVEKANPTPTRKTFVKLFGNDPTAINRRIAEYCKAKILIKNPECYPLRSISNAEVRSYKIEHDLLSPRR